jgi:hypothetical protein
LTSRTTPVYTHLALPDQERHLPCAVLFLERPGCKSKQAFFLVRAEPIQPGIPRDLGARPRSWQMIPIIAGRISKQLGWETKQTFFIQHIWPIQPNLSGIVMA